VPIALLLPADGMEHGQLYTVHELIFSGMNQNESDIHNVGRTSDVVVQSQSLHCSIHDQYRDEGVPSL
jgi:hypothetical protein